MLELLQEAVTPSSGAENDDLNQVSVSHAEICLAFLAKLVLYAVALSCVFDILALVCEGVYTSYRIYFGFGLIDSQYAFFKIHLNVKATFSFMPPCDVGAGS